MKNFRSTCSFALPWVALVFAVTASGCATTLSTLQTAKTVPPHHFEFTGGLGFYAPTGAGSNLIAVAMSQARAGAIAAATGKPFAVSDETKEDLITGGVALAVLPPSPGWEISARAGLFENLDVGLRYSVNAVRLDTKFRFFHRGEDPISGTLDPSAGEGIGAQPVVSHRSYDLALGVGVSHYLFDNPVLSLLEQVQIDNFSRWDLEVPLYASAELGEHFRIYGAPKYVFSRTHLDETLLDYAAQASQRTGVDLFLPSQVDSHFFGATAGVAFAFRPVRLMLELTAGYTDCRPVLLGRTRQLGGLTLYPAVGVALQL